MNHICPSCQETITRLTKKKGCPNCNVQLHKLGPGEYILKSEEYTPKKILELFELRVSQATKSAFYFQRGRAQAAQLHHCYLLFSQIKEYLTKQPSKLDLPDEAFALLVVAEIMNDDYAQNASGVYGLTKNLMVACKTIYLEKINQQKSEALSHSIDLSPKFEVMIF